MTEKSKAQRRREAAEYWDTHGIDEGVTDDDVEEAFEVRKPLAAMLTFRLDEDDLAKLKLIAETRNVGITTMARMLLHQSLTSSKNRLVSEGLRSEPVGEQTATIPEDAEPDGLPEYLVLRTDQIKQIDHLVKQNTIRLFLDGLREQAITVTPEQAELFDKLKELEPVH